MQVVVYVFEIFQSVAVVGIGGVSIFEVSGCLKEEGTDFFIVVLFVFVTSGSFVVEGIGVFAELTAIVVEGGSVVAVKIKTFLV